jgi:hypothetical protein
MKMVSENCWIMLKRLPGPDGKYTTFMFCQSKQNGLPCPRDCKGGKRPYELGPSCFEVMSDGDFLNTVVLPGFLEPRASREARGPASDFTLGDVPVRKEAEKVGDDDDGDSN